MRGRLGGLSDGRGGRGWLARTAHAWRRRASLVVVVCAEAWVIAPVAQAQAAAHVYWVNNLSGFIGDANLNGTGVNQSFITGAAVPSGIAVDPQHIYWANFGSNTIAEANLNGSGVNESFITGAAAPSGVAVNASHVYWTNQITGTIGEANRDGTGAKAAMLSVCLRMALAIPKPPAASGPAHSAAGACGRIDAAVQVKLTHSAAGYRGAVSGSIRKLKRTRLKVTCRRRGTGLLLTVRRGSAASRCAALRARSSQSPTPTRPASR